ncbi:hypothetical protein [Amycolatopsis pigmentata]|uniref:Uncharacterized protein n=1 Tax=Amycolatopsis pigmentata TaxID=450801 RepID=A0ABW5FZ53_9PSEU
MTSFVETYPSATPTPVQRSRAVRVVASAARDAADLAELLDMLGLDAKEGTGTLGEVPAVGEAAVPQVSGQHRLTIAELHALVATVSH